MERFSAWSLHTLISLTVLCAIADSYGPSERDEKENFALATACISLILSFTVTISHIFRSMRKHLVGTLLEMRKFRPENRNAYSFCFGWVYHLTT